jgi:archaellum component FlaC
MDVDERLERLTQRHEALTQTVELLTKDLSDMKVLVNDIAEGTARLLHVAEIHESGSADWKTRNHDPDQL